MWGLGAKMAPKTKFYSKEIELSFWIHSILLDEIVIFVYSFVKIGWKMAKLWPWEARAKVASGLFCANWWPFWPSFWDMDFKLVLPSIYINFDVQTKFEVNQTQIGHSIPKKTPKTHQSGHISKPHFVQVSFNEFVCNFQNRCKYGFCTYYSWPIFDLGLQKNFEPKSKKS